VRMSSDAPYRTRTGRPVAVSKSAAICSSGGRVLAAANTSTADSSPPDRQVSPPTATASSTSDPRTAPVTDRFMPVWYGPAGEFSLASPGRPIKIRPTASPPARAAVTPINRRSFLAATAAAVAAPKLLAASPAKFQLGLVTYNVAANWDLGTILSTCKEVGVAAVECRTTHKHGVEPSLSAAARKDVKAKFADAGVRFWGCGSTCEFHAADKATVEKNIEECKRFVQLAADLGGQGVKVRPNGVAKGMSVEQATAQIGKALIPCGKAAADAGVEIWVEVHGAVTQLPKNMRAIMDACGHPAVGVTWNSNGTDVENGSIEAGFALLKPFIKSCHITDLTQDAAGKYPYRDLFRRFAAMGYDRYTLCEYGKSFDPGPGKAFLAGYKKLWTELMSG
jgi:sugar phosphate isomerase/epimerase